MASKKQTEELKEILIERKNTINSNIQDSIDNISKLNDCECKDDLDFAEASSDSFTSGIIVNQQKQEAVREPRTSSHLLRLYPSRGY